MSKNILETTLYSLDSDPPAPPLRRRAQRHLSLYRVGALTIGERRELCLIKNVSAGGMLIRAYVPIAAGTRLSVELKQAEPLSGTARWSRNDAVGIAFDAPVDIVSLISASLTGRRPRMPRIEVNCLAQVRAVADITRCRVVNISQGGLRIIADADLAVGANVVVTINGMSPEPATVSWRDGDHHGLKFDRVLAITQLVAWLHLEQDRELRRPPSRATG